MTIPDAAWMDKLRLCVNKSLHFGELQLITWTGTDGYESWGDCVPEES